MIEPREGTVVAGRYALVRPLASGGMGSVWIAHHLELQVDVTVKFMAPALVANADLRTRFEREARAAARLDSQHVVHVLDYGLEGGAPYFVMELLKGESLATRLKRAGRLSYKEAARMVVQVCKALRTAHEAGLVHRDLKPGNVFLAFKDGDEVAKVLDFGIAKAGFGEAGANTGADMMLGTVQYMSPEQIRSSRGVDHRSDLWSLGVILYRALTGRLPFQGTDQGDIIVRVCTDPVAPPSSVAADLSPRIDAFFARALARNPDQRFQSASELAEAFSATMMQVSVEPSLEVRLRSAKRTDRLARPELPRPAAAELVASNVTTKESPRRAPAQAEAPEGRPRAPMPSSADDPTIAFPEMSEGPPESTSAPLASDREVEPRPVRSPQATSRPTAKPLWIAAIAAAAMTAGVLVSAAQKAISGRTPATLPSSADIRLPAPPPASSALSRSLAPPPPATASSLAPPIASASPATPLKSAPLPAPRTTGVPRGAPSPGVPTQAPPVVTVIQPAPAAAPRPPPPPADPLKDLLP